MKKLLVLVLCSYMMVSTAQDIHLPLAGTFSDTIDVLSQQPSEDATFALAMVYFLQGFEGLGQAWYRYGLREDRRDAFVLDFNLPVTDNPAPEAFGYTDLRKVLEEFLANLTKVNALLEPLIVNEQEASFYLEPHHLAFDIDGDGVLQEDEDFDAILRVLSMNDMRDFESVNAGDTMISQVSKIRFDTADIYWLSAYAHLLSFMSELILAHDSSILFDSTAQYFFPNVDTPTPLPIVISEFDIESDMVDVIAMLHLMLRVPLLEAERMPKALEHLQYALQLSQQSWQYILEENDDEAEWIPNPAQRSAIGARLTTEQIDGWNIALAELEAVSKGELLIPHWRFAAQGFNLAKYFTEPTTFDLVLLLQGASALPYMEDGEFITGEALLQLDELFGGNGFGFALWLN